MAIWCKILQFHVNLDNSSLKYKLKTEEDNLDINIFWSEAD